MNDYDEHLRYNRIMFKKSVLCIGLISNYTNRNMNFPTTKDNTT